jgi:hypothetical protein
MLTDTEVRNAKPKDRPYKLADGGWRPFTLSRMGKQSSTQNVQRPRASHPLGGLSEADGAGSRGVQTARRTFF